MTKKKKAKLNFGWENEEQRKKEYLLRCMSIPQVKKLELLRYVNEFIYKHSTKPSSKALQELGRVR